MCECIPTALSKCHNPLPQGGSWLPEKIKHPQVTSCGASALLSLGLTSSPNSPLIFLHYLPGLLANLSWE